LVQNGLGATGKLKLKADRPLIATVLTQATTDTLGGQAGIGSDGRAPRPIRQAGEVQSATVAGLGTCTAEGAGSQRRIQNWQTTCVSDQYVFRAGLNAVAAAGAQILETSLIRARGPDGLGLLM